MCTKVNCWFFSPVADVAVFVLYNETAWRSLANEKEEKTRAGQDSRLECQTKVIK